MNKIKFDKIIILVFIAVLFTTSSCWDVGVGPYESEKGYCEYKKYSDDSSALCFAILMIEIENNREIINNACLMILFLEENSCKNKPTYKPYWIF